jgi:hypothetical protein
MNPELVKYITSVQKRIFNSTNRKTDAYYEEGKGVLFIPKGAPLRKETIMHAIPWMQVEVSMMTGNYHI